MSTKFNSNRPAYVLPPWCLAPPIKPLPPVPPVIPLAQAALSIWWPLSANVQAKWDRVARDIKQQTPTKLALEVDVGGESVRVEIMHDATRITAAGLTAYRGGLFMASVSWTPGYFIPWPSWSTTYLLFPDFRIPSTAGGRIILWL
jgi:hypothetical protein